MIGNKKKFQIHLQKKARLQGSADFSYHMNVRKK